MPSAGIGTGFYIGQYTGQCTQFIGAMLGFQPYGNGNQQAYTLVNNHGWRFTAPQPGSVGSSLTDNHVVYALSVSGSQVYIGEGNYNFSGTYNERWVDAGSFSWASR